MAPARLPICSQPLGSGILSAQGRPCCIQPSCLSLAMACLQYQQIERLGRKMTFTVSFFGLSHGSRVKGGTSHLCFRDVLQNRRLFVLGGERAEDFVCMYPTSLCFWTCSPWRSASAVDFKPPGDAHFIPARPGEVATWPRLV